MSYLAARISRSFALLSCVLVVAFASITLAGDVTTGAGSISGTVSDGAGKPVANLTLQLVVKPTPQVHHGKGRGSKLSAGGFDTSADTLAATPAPKVAATTTTDKAGLFKFDKVAVGTYIIQGSQTDKVGQQVFEPLDVAADKESKVDIKVE